MKHLKNSTNFHTLTEIFMQIYMIQKFKTNFIWTKLFA